MENNLNTTQNVNETQSPQTTGEAPVANDSSDFQKSADATALDKYKNTSVKVNSTGQPISGGNVLTNNTGAAVLFTVVATLVLLLIASSVFKWVMKRPAPEEKLVEEKKTEAVTIKKPVTKKSKVKKTRSQRRK